MSEQRRYLNALAWVFDRLSIDGGMSDQEQKTTMAEIGKVILGQPSRAADYVPSHEPSANLLFR